MAGILKRILYCINLSFLQYTDIEVMTVKSLKSSMIFGVIFVLILGTMSHFFYEWSKNNFIIGLFTPVSESVWEHMKLIFFPMLLYFLILLPKLGTAFPCFVSAFSSGILLGTLLIPVIYYTYTGILGYNTLPLDIGTFIISVIAAFYSVYRLTLSGKLQGYTHFLCAALWIFGICFIVFTYDPGALNIFRLPSENRT